MPEDSMQQLVIQGDDRPNSFRPPSDHSLAWGLIKGGPLQFDTTGIKKREETPIPSGWACHWQCEFTIRFSTLQWFQTSIFQILEHREASITLPSIRTRHVPAVRYCKYSKLVPDRNSYKEYSARSASYPNVWRNWKSQNRGFVNPVFLLCFVY